MTLAAPNAEIVRRSDDVDAACAFLSERRHRTLIYDNRVAGFLPQNDLGIATPEGARVICAPWFVGKSSLKPRALMSRNGFVR